MQQTANPVLYCLMCFMCGTVCVCVCVCVRAVDRFVSSNKLPHLLLYGPPGTGKTSTALALAKKIFGYYIARNIIRHHAV